MLQRGYDGFDLRRKLLAERRGKTKVAKTYEGEKIVYLLGRKGEELMSRRETVRVNDFPKSRGESRGKEELAAEVVLTRALR